MTKKPRRRSALARDRGCPRRSGARASGRRGRARSASSRSAKSGTLRRTSTGALPSRGDHSARGGRKREARRSLAPMRTQAALYDEIDLELSWSEAELPERERTKHVHRLHPYLGKFVPQLAEVFLRRYATPGPARLGSVRRLGDDARRGERLRRARGRLRHLGFQLPAHAREDGRRTTARRCSPTSSGCPSRARPAAGAQATRRVPRGSWFAPARARRAARIPRRGSTGPRIRSSGASSCRARPARRGSRATTTSTSRASPCSGEYFCHKHRRVCRPVGEADKFLRRYVRDAVAAGAGVRRPASPAAGHGSPRRRAARSIRPARSTSSLTSPPYPGLIDYHEQHAYAFELLGLERRDAEEIGRGVTGYCDDVAAVLAGRGDALAARAARS